LKLCEISLITPAFNEAAGIARAVEKFRDVLSGLTHSWEIVVVDDGSRDATYDVVKGLGTRDARIRGVRLSRNFGKEAAILAGLATANGNCLITIDSDLQHPPDTIHEMYALFQRGYEIVHAVKRQRLHDSFVARLRANVFNQLLQSLSGIELINSSDFKLLSRRVADVLTRELGERKRLYRGLVSWVGFNQTTVLFDVAERMEGETKFSTRQLLALALTAIVSFTAKPLRIVAVLGLFTLLLGVGVGSEALWSWSQGEAVSGFTTIVGVVLIIGSFVMLALAIIGEYLAKIYEEVKGRPMYLINEITPSQLAGSTAHQETIDEKAGAAPLHRTPVEHSLTKDLS
jgi:glycosyltransferase involved in cell wall biosynthesis